MAAKMQPSRKKQSSIVVSFFWAACADVGCFIFWLFFVCFFILVLWSELFSGSFFNGLILFHGLIFWLLFNIFLLFAQFCVIMDTNHLEV